MEKNRKGQIFEIEGKKITGKYWIEKMYQEFESILKYQDDLPWTDDNQKYHITYTLTIEKD